MIYFEHDRSSKAYSATTFANHLMSSLFKFYYVKVFLIHFKVSDEWFQRSQILLMVWNAINDPLFGYIQDNSSWRVFRCRRLTILYGSPFFALSFLLFWFPWSSSSSCLEGLHLVVSLFLWDALYTFVILAQCALFAEMSGKHEDRVRLVLYDQCASLFGAASVCVAEFLSSGLRDFRAFQATCVIITVIAWAAMTLTGLFADTGTSDPDMTKPDLTNSDLTKPNLKKPEATSPNFTTPSFLRQTLDILEQGSFLSFVVTNFLQILHITFHSNFLAIFLDVLISDQSFSPTLLSLFKGFLLLFPQLLVLFLQPWLRSLDPAFVVRRSFALKILFALLFAIHLLFSPPSSTSILLFLLVDSSLAQAVFSTFNLLVAAVVDEDRRRHRRPRPISSSIFGTNAFLTKPAVSIAPIMVVSFLNPSGFDGYKRDPVSFLKEDDSVDDSDLTRLRSAILSLLWAWPLIIGSMQILAFSFYKLKSIKVPEKRS